VSSILKTAQYVLGFVKIIAAAGKPVLDIEYPTSKSKKSLVRKQARANGLTWLITDRGLTTLGESGR
jgi:hypothetical protein